MSLEFIAEMGWKSLIISAAALGVLVLLRSRSAADRATLLRLAVGLLLALPLLSVSLPALIVEEPAAPTLLQPVLTSALDGPALQTEALFQAVYLAGLLVVAARLLVGLWTLRRWTRAARPIMAPHWRAALVRTGGARVRLLVSDLAPSPMSWGLRRPVILIDRASLARPDDAEAILAHEMAHVARKDWPALMLSRLAVALFWFNPLVWLLERCLVQHAEEAADLQAVAQVEPVGYARTLLECVRSTGLVAAPANSMAPGQGLARRLGAVLDPRQRGLKSGSLWTTTAMLACIALTAPVAAVELTRPGPADAPPPAARIIHAAPLPPDRADAAAVAVERFASALQARAVSRSRSQAPRLAELAPVIDAPHVKTSTRPGIEFARGRAEDAPDFASAAVPELTRVSASALSLDQAVQLRALGVDTNQVEALAALGYRDLTTNQLVSMSVFRVTPDFITDLAKLGYRGLTPEQLIELRVHRITPAYIGAWAAQGLAGLTVDEMVQLRVRPRRGQTPQEEISQRFFGGPDNAIHRTSIIGPSPEALVQMRFSKAL